MRTYQRVPLYGRPGESRRQTVERAIDELEKDSAPRGRSRGRSSYGTYSMSPRQEENRVLLIRLRMERDDLLKQEVLAEKYPAMTAQAETWPHDHAEKHRQAALKGHRNRG